MAHFDLIIASFAIVATAVHAQPGPKFEVASVKLSPPYQPSRATGVRLDAAQFTAFGLPLRNLIYSAYGVPPWRLLGGPNWLEEAYDIAATLPPNTPPAQINAMLQALFADRFHLAVHRETKDYSVLALLVGKQGPKLTASPQGCKFSVKNGRGHIELRCASVPAFVSYLSPALDRPVIDMTALKGLFDLTVDWTPDSVEPKSDAAAPSISHSLQQLGLRLESRKAPTEFVVIDHVERPPEN